MDLIRGSIERPVAVMAVVLMALLFGVLALLRIPIQLVPEVTKPVITVATNWPGAAPIEVEKEIITRQEDALRGLENLEEMQSTAQRGSGSISLEFAVGTDLDKALMLVGNRLDRVTNLPAEAGSPTLSTSGSEDNPIAWFALTPIVADGPPLATYRDFVVDVVKERLERVPGIAQVNINGGAAREIQIIVDPQRLAALRLTPAEVLDRLRRETISISAGTVDEGKRRYVVRVDADHNSLASIRAMVLRTDGTGTVTVGDVAEVRMGFKETDARIRYRGEDAITLNATRESGANVIAVMKGVRAAVAELDSGPLPHVGLRMRLLYDETVYINSAIKLVTSNIWQGGLLAALVLLLFLRSSRATLVVALAIPVSVVASFVAMAATGRSLNVISLAGFAFAVGMVVDAAIVVLENIFRLRQQGMPIAEAAWKGAKQVWGAILVSSLTTVMVFTPILVMELEIGQLFRDIGVAISVAVMLSLLVAVTVVPALANALLTAPPRPLLRLPGIDHLGRGFVALVMGVARLTVGRIWLGVSVAAAVSVVALILAWSALPKMEYLPEGNRNLIIGNMQPPPGYNLATSMGIGANAEAIARPLWEGSEGKPPIIQNFFFIARPGSNFMAASHVDDTKAAILKPLLSKAVFSEPGAFGFVTQPSIFGRGIGGARAVSLDVSGGELSEILAVAQKAAQRIDKVLPRKDGHQLRPRPGLELGAPELRLLPDRAALARAGLDARSFATGVDVFNDGVEVTEVMIDGRRLDLMLRGPADGVANTQGIGQLPVVTRNGMVVPVNQLAQVELTAGPTEIRRLERLRTITLELRPAAEMPVEVALEIMQTQVVEALVAEGLPDGVRLSLSGVAGKLQESWLAMKGDLLLAILIVFLVMAILFESFVFPLSIMVTIPVALAGGVAGLWLLNQFDRAPLDMLTLLGFVILMGIVVNNAILMVDQALFHHRQEGMDPIAAILASTENRLRPIFMSTTTTVLGMMPLVVTPGAGAELYRGLGAVIVGGLSVSALLTLLVLPPLMRVGFWLSRAKGRVA